MDRKSLKLVRWAGTRFSPARLARIASWYRSQFEKSAVTGAVVAIGRSGKLVVEAVGPWSVLDFEKGKPVSVEAISPTEFRYDGGDRTRLAFMKDPADQVSGVVLNPGLEQVEVGLIKLR